MRIPSAAVTVNTSAVAASTKRSLYAKDPLRRVLQGGKGIVDGIDCDNVDNAGEPACQCLDPTLKETKMCKERTKASSLKVAKAEQYTAMSSEAPQDSFLKLQNVILKSPTGVTVALDVIGCVFQPIDPETGRNGPVTSSPTWAT